MIHFYSLSGKNIVFDVNSSSLHEVDEPAFIILKSIGCRKWPEEGLNAQNPGYKLVAEKFGTDVAESTATELTSLYYSGMLYSDDAFKDLIDQTVENRIADPVIKAMCLHVSHDCNLRCRYCFAETGHFGGERLNMPPEIAMKAIDFLIHNSYGRTNLEIDFFGGEPLLAMETVKAAVTYGKNKGKENGKKINFTLTTNATLLDNETSDYINANMDNIVLSIDGRPRVHDFMRIQTDKKGSYNLAVDNAKKIIKNRGDKQYFVRGTFTRNNLDFSNDVLHLAALGFKSISVEPVVTHKEKYYSIREEDLSEIFKEYERLAASCLKAKKSGKPFTFFHFEVDLDNGPCLYKRAGGCGSGVEYIAVTPDGDIYPCHQFVGNKKFLMGNVNVGITAPDIRKIFARTNIYSVKECKDCWAKFLCSGGCTAAAYNYGGGFGKPYSIGCELEKKRLECALWLKTMEATEVI